MMDLKQQGQLSSIPGINEIGDREAECLQGGFYVDFRDGGDNKLDGYRSERDDKGEHLTVGIPKGADAMRLYDIGQEGKRFEYAVDIRGVRGDRVSREMLTSSLL